MNSAQPLTVPDSTKDPKSSGLLTGLRAALLLFAFLVGVSCLGEGFKLLGKDALATFLAATSNPFLALMVGILSTSLVQSSSVTTALIVGLVAAPENPLPLTNAVPMVMGANIGTTVTNTLVSIAHMGRPDEFRRAFSIATCHDFFNYMAVLIMLPLEITTGFLSRAADGIAQLLTGAGGVEFESPIKGLLSAGSEPIRGLAGLLFTDSRWQGVTIILISGLLIFGSLYFLVRTMRRALGASAGTMIERVLGRAPLLAMLIGALATMMVQSSSITTSLLVPLGGAGIITLERAFPVTLGANVGTTVTALMAALAVSGVNAHFGVAIALTHLLFNLLGILTIYPAPMIRRLPLLAARKLAAFAVKSRYAALAYVALLFYGLPALFAFLTG